MMRIAPAIARRCPGPRRGAVGVSTVIGLVFMQLMVVGSILTGARDQDTSVQRIDSLRAFYATEAAANMSIREMMSGLDEDGDGGVGTISNDANATNDPAVGTAKFYVTSSTTSALTTLVPKGRAGLCRRMGNAVIQGGSGSASGGSSVIMCGITRDNQKAPRYSVYGGSSWGTNTAMPWSVLGDVKSITLQPCPTRNEIMAGMIDDQNDYSIAFFNGTSWGAVTRVGTDIARDGDRPAHVAYEQLSGDGLIVYWDDTSNEFAYRTWNGTTLSGQVLMSSSGADHSHFVGLYPKTGTNEIMCLCNDHNTQERLLAKVWNGASWSAWTVISTALPKHDRECFAGAYESLSGKGLAVYGETGQAQPRYRTWNGSSWSSASTLPTIGKNPYWVRLAADPATNTIIAGMADQDKDLEVNVWNGTSWGTNYQFTADQGGDQPRMYDIAFPPGSSQAVAFYRNNSKKYPVYRTFDGTSWSLEQNGPNINRTLKYMQLAQGFSNGELYLAVCDSSDDLHLFKWSGSSLSSDTIIETSLSDGQEPANIAGSPAAGNKAKVLSWVEMEP